MARKRREMPQEAAGAPEWMVTYSDLVTLLLCFFVLLFSMAVIDKQKFIEVANSFRGTFQETDNGGDMFNSNSGGVRFGTLQKNSTSNIVNEQDIKKERNQSQEIQKNGANQKTKASENNIANIESTEVKKLEQLQKELQAAVTSLKLDNYIKVINEENVIILRIDSVVLFDSGSANIKNSGHEVLLKTGKLLKELENEVLIQGHTDNLPISTQLYPSNWELSTKRATNVVLFMIKTMGLNPAKLTATGNGEHRPIMDNDTEKNREKNRRIDIVIVKNEIS